MAVQKGYVTMAQIKDCVRLKIELEATGLDLKLGELLVKKGYMTPGQVDDILAGQTKKSPVQSIAGFELVSKLGEGAMGSVYKARQVSLDRMVALKILPKRLARNKEFVARFEREAKIVARLSHPNIVRGIDMGEENGFHYLAMEFIQGESIGQIIARKGRLDETEALEFVLQIARAIEHADKQGVLHRDIKPDNILVEAKSRTAKLADMGLARLVERAQAEQVQLTQQGDAIGTPYYSSPEQSRGELDLEIRSDIYNLGATFYHMITGTPPFRGNTAAVVMTKHINEPLEPPAQRCAGISAGVSAVIEKMMAKRPEDRHQTPAALIEDLERLQRGEQPLALKSRPGRPAKKAALPRRQSGRAMKRAKPARASGRTGPPASARRAPVREQEPEVDEEDIESLDEAPRSSALKSFVYLLLVIVAVASAVLAVYYLGVKGFSLSEILERLGLS